MMPLELAQLIAAAEPSSIVRDPRTGLYTVPTSTGSIDVTFRDFDAAEKVLAFRTQATWKAR